MLATAKNNKSAFLSCFEGCTYFNYLAENENLQFVERGGQLIFCGDLLMFGLLQLQASVTGGKRKNESGNFLIKLAAIGSR